jgi:hypothetical protein
MLFTSKTFKDINSIFRVHQLKPPDKVKLPIFALILSKLFSVKIANIIKPQLLHVDSFIRLLDLHDSFGRLIWYDNDHTFEYGVILIERLLRTGTTFGNHLRRYFFLYLL